MLVCRISRNIRARNKSSREQRYFLNAMVVKLGRPAGGNPPAFFMG